MVAKYLLLLLLLLTSTIVSAQFRADTITDVNPWTKAPTITGDKYRFVIVADITGGERPGVFKRGLKKINKKNPDFVISVGDLIEGYTTNSDLINKEWGAFEKNLSVLKVPFFYIAGNHDVSNKILEEYWNNKFRATYYRFNIGESLFLILNTEEITDSDIGISERQSNYFVEQIIAHKSESPIFVFMHTPVWRYSDDIQYRKIHKALEGNNAFVFSGHTHRYMYAKEGRVEQFTLATMAGGSELRGVYMGEFDHYMTVDVDGSDVNIKNTLLDGTKIPNDVVSVETEPYVDALSYASWISVDNILLDSRYVNRISSRFKLSNTLNHDLFIEPIFKSNPKFETTPIAEKITVTKRSDEIVNFNLSNDNLIDIEDIGPLLFNFNALYIVNENRMQSPGAAILKLDYIRDVGEEWSRIPVKNPHYVTESWNWFGEKDGWYELFIKTVNGKTHIKVVTHDDIVITDPDASRLQDRIYLDFKSEGLEISNLEIINDSKYSEQGIDVECGLEDGNLTANIVVPTIGLSEFRLNIGFLDCDSSLNDKPSILWWRDKTNLEFGKFRIKF